MFKNYEYKYNGLNEKEIEEKLNFEILDALHKKYGADPDKRIVMQVQEEWDAIRQAGLIQEVAFLHEITSWLRKKGYNYHLLDDTAGSLILYLLKVTIPNPLSAHLYCEQCHTVQWMPEYKSGWDIPPDRCIVDGCKRMGDGHGLAWQFMWKYYEEGQRLFYMLLPYVFEDYIVDFLENHWLKSAGAVEIEIWDAKTDTKVFVWDKIMFDCFERIEAPDYDVVLDDRRIEKAYIEWSHCQWAWIENGFIHAAKVPQPRTFAELTVNYGLVSCVWEDKIEHLFRKGGFSVEGLLYYREDIFKYLKQYQYSDDDAIKIIQNFSEAPVTLLKAIKNDGHWFIGDNEILLNDSKAIAVANILNKICYGKICNDKT